MLGGLIFTLLNTSQKKHKNIFLRMKTQRKFIFGQLRGKKSDYIQTSLKDL